jgi:alpha-beta hydrolase superfamily lysophospholipase
MHSFKISSLDHISVQAYSWFPQNKPVAILQIAHGMQEHACRYDHFAMWLNEHGIAVYANDHIGHGLSAKTEAELSHFPRKDDWQRSMDFLHTLMQKIKTDHPGVPVFLLGHSMGSVLAQSYMIRYGNESDGFILSGAIRQPVFMANIGQFIATVLAGIFGPADRSRITVFLGYGQYNNHFKPNRTKCDWLCSNDSVVDEYIASPLCGIPLTNRFYQNFFYGFRFIARHSNLKKIPAGKPVFIIAGKDDPAGIFGKAPLKIKQLLSKYARANVDLKLYPRLRHEILNEKTREEVYNDVLRWITQNISH